MILKAIHELREEKTAYGKTRTPEFGTTKSVT